jgi:hypothetical protein
MNAQVTAAMNNTHSIPATALRDHAKAHGWTLVNEALADRLFVLNHERFKPKQLAFPMDEQAPDFQDSIQRNIVRLAEFEHRSLDQLVQDLLHVNNDRIAFRLTGQFEGSSIPLMMAQRLLAATDTLIRTSACTAFEPRPNYAKLNRSEAKDMAAHARFAHTQMGSFVINIACPIYAMDDQASLEFGETNPDPFVRRATRALFGGAKELVGMIERGEFSTQRTDSTPSLVSKNLCEALLEFFDEELKNSLDIGFRWASALPMRSGCSVSMVSIKREHVAYIERLRRYLTPTKDAQRLEFMCTVEELAGKTGEDLLRTGEVVLQLFDGTTTVRAKAMLDARQYADAIVAHKHTQYVRVEGILRPGNQPRSLDQIAVFELQRR